MNIKQIDREGKEPLYIIATDEGLELKDGEISIKVTRDEADKHILPVLLAYLLLDDISESDNTLVSAHYVDDEPDEVSYLLTAEWAFAMAAFLVVALFGAILGQTTVAHYITWIGLLGAIWAGGMAWWVYNYG